MWSEIYKLTLKHKNLRSLDSGTLANWHQPMPQAPLTPSSCPWPHRTVAADQPQRIHSRLIMGCTTIGPGISCTSQQEKGFPSLSSRRVHGPDRAICDFVYATGCQFFWATGLPATSVQDSCGRIWTNHTQDNSYLVQLMPNTTRTQDKLLPRQVDPLYLGNSYGSVYTNMHTHKYIYFCNH